MQRYMQRYMGSVTEGSSICMGLPPEDGGLFGFMSFRAIGVFPRPPTTAYSYIFTPRSYHLDMGVLSTAGGPLLGAC